MHLKPFPDEILHKEYEVKDAVGQLKWSSSAPISAHLPYKIHFKIYLKCYLKIGIIDPTKWNYLFDFEPPHLDPIILSTNRWI